MPELEYRGSSAAQGPPAVVPSLPEASQDSGLGWASWSVGRVVLTENDSFECLRNRYLKGCNNSSGHSGYLTLRYGGVAVIPSRLTKSSAPR